MAVVFILYLEPRLEFYLYFSGFEGAPPGTQLMQPSAGYNTKEKVETTSNRSQTEGQHTRPANASSTHQRPQRQATHQNTNSNNRSRTPRAQTQSQNQKPTPTTGMMIAILLNTTSISISAHRLTETWHL